MDFAPRYTIPEAAKVLKLGRATLYARIKAGLLHVTKDGARTFVTGGELKRYLDACAGALEPASAAAS